MTVVRADFDTRKTVSERFADHMKFCDGENAQRDEAIKAAIQNEYITRMRLERFVGSTMFERLKWVLFGISPFAIKKPEAKPAEPEAPKMQVVAGDGEVSNG